MKVAIEKYKLAREETVSGIPISDNHYRLGRENTRGIRYRFIIPELPLITLNRANYFGNSRCGGFIEFDAIFRHLKISILERW